MLNNITHCPFCIKEMGFKIRECSCESCFEIAADVVSNIGNIISNHIACRKIDNYGVVFNEYHLNISILKWVNNIYSLAYFNDVIFTFAGSFEDFVKLDSNKIQLYMTFS